MKTFIAIILAAAFASTALGQPNSTDRQFMDKGTPNGLLNPGAEFSKRNITMSSASTLSINTTGVYLHTGAASFMFDSTAATQRLIFSLDAASSDYTKYNGKRMEFSCWYYTPSTVSTYKLGLMRAGVALDIYTDLLPTDSSKWKKAKIEFDYDSTITAPAPIIQSTASNEDEVYIDDCYFGPVLLDKTNAGQDPPDLIKIGDAESGYGGALAFADAAQTFPENGTGGSAIVALSMTDTGPLEKERSFTYVKDASNRQGQGVSFPFALPTPKPVVYQIEFDYAVSSGTFVAGNPNDYTSAGDSDVTVWVYGVTSSTLIQPTTHRLYSSTSGVTHFVSNFQGTATDISYRLIFFSGTTSASAYTLKIDGPITVKPAKYSYGTPISDWASFTPTGSWVTNTTYTGLWRRVGGNAEIQWGLALSGAPTSATLTLNLPTGAVIDTSKITNTGGSFHLNSNANGNRGGTGVPMLLLYNNTTSVLAAYNNSFTSQAVVNATAPVTWANGDKLEFTVDVPIAGWASTTQMSDQGSSRIAAVDIFGTATTVGSSLATLTPTTIVGDTHAAWSGSSWTVPSSGWYNVSAILQGSSTSVSTWEVYYQRNSMTEVLLGGSRISTTGFQYASGSHAAYFSGGDTIKFRGLSNTGSSTPNYFSASIISSNSPSVMSMTDNVSFSYSTSTARTVNSTGPVVIYETLRWDTHAMYNSSTGVATISVPGEYEVQACFYETAVVHTLNHTTALQVKKNGSLGVAITQERASTTSSMSSTDCGAAKERFNAGDTFSIAGYADTTNTLGASAPTLNYFSVRRVGN